MEPDVGLRTELIKHLSKEIEVLSTNIISTRLRATFTIWIGPFVLLGALVIRQKPGHVVLTVNDYPLIAAFVLLGVLYLLIAYAAGRMERYVADKCNEWRDLLVLVLVEQTLKADAIRTSLHDPYLHRKVQIAYAGVFAAMFASFILILYIVIHVDVV